MFWPKEPWTLSNQGSQAAVGRKVIIDAIRTPASSSILASAPAARAEPEEADSNSIAMADLSVFAETLNKKKETPWTPSLPPSKEQLKELEEIAACFGTTTSSSSTNQAVLAADRPEASKSVRISEQTEIREFEVEKISKSTTKKTADGGNSKIHNHCLQAPSRSGRE